MTGSNEILGLGDGLTDDPIGALVSADLLTEFTFVVRRIFDTTFFHFFVNHATEVDFGDTSLREVVDDNGFATATHANDGEDFDVSRCTHRFNYSTRRLFAGGVCTRE